MKEFSTIWQFDELSFLLKVINALKTLRFHSQKLYIFRMKLNS